MTELSTEQRLAALQARKPKPQPAPDSAPDLPTVQVAPERSALYRDAEFVESRPSMLEATTVMTVADQQPAQADRTGDVHGLTRRQFQVPWNRVAAGGASVVSFASMIVAMGPILKISETEEVGATELDQTVNADGQEIPAAPPVDIQAAAAADASPLAVTVEPVAADGTPATEDQVSTGPAPAQDQNPETVATPAPEPEDQTPATQAPVDSEAPTTVGPTESAAPETTPQTEPPASASPTTAPPATQPPTTAPPETQPPNTEAPTTQPPATAAPTTPAPTTVPPTTAPPATAPAATPPPKSDGSG